MKKGPTHLESVKDAKRQGRSFIARSWKPWPKNTRGDYDILGIDRVISDGVSAVRGLISVLEASEEQRQALLAQVSNPADVEVKP